MPNERKRRKLFWQHVQGPGQSHPCDSGLENEIIGEGWEIEPVKEEPKLLKQHRTITPAAKLSFVKNLEKARSVLAIKREGLKV